MIPESEQLEREAEDTRCGLQATLEELCAQVTPRAVFDQVIEYARRGPAREFFRNLVREVQENPIPLVLIGISITWLAVSAHRSSRALIASRADSISKRASEIGAATSGVAGRTSEAAAHLAGRIGEAGDAVGKRTADLAVRARNAAGGLAETAQEVFALTTALGKEEWPFASAAERGCAPAVSVRDDRQPAPVGRGSGERLALPNPESGQ
jgi:hypothetical protein